MLLRQYELKKKNVLTKSEKETIAVNSFRNGETSLNFQGDQNIIGGRFGGNDFLNGIVGSKIV